MAHVVISGAVANKPLNGGAAWTRLSWALGFARLGFDVFFVEEIESEMCRDGDGNPAPLGASVACAFFDEVMHFAGLSGSAVLVLGSARETHGMAWDDLVEVVESCDLLVNLSGHLSRPLLDRARRKVYVDLDPGFTQLWEATRQRGARLEGHDWFFTVGMNIGRRACTIPSAGVRWRTIRQPVVLEHWPRVEVGGSSFTTVGAWRGPYGAITWRGMKLGLKVHEFRKFLDLPLSASEQFEIALDIHPADAADVAALAASGWRIVDPAATAGTPAAFQAYVQGSKAEFSVAQSMYVQTCSGWFSDRTTRYLASGKPALVQRTGLERHLPVGDGLLTFADMDEAVAGVRSICDRYDGHARAARELAETYFDARLVLGSLVDEVGVSP